MKTQIPRRARGFTLLETVIAIGVLAVLLTGFMIVFAPAATGIRKAINVQEADRLASTVEQELVTYRQETITPEGSQTGFAKAFQFIKSSNDDANALMVYQYRADLSANRPDGTPNPLGDVKNKMVGKDYVVRSILRRKGDQEFLNDLPAVEGSVYFVKCTQLVFQGSELKPGSPGQIRDPKASAGGGGGNASSDDYPEAVIAFAADFYAVPSKSADYFSNGFSKTFNSAKTPVFSRNLAVRR